MALFTACVPCDAASPSTADVSKYLQVPLGGGLNHPSLDPAALHHKFSKAIVQPYE